MQGFRNRHQGNSPAGGGEPGRVAPEGMPRQVPEGSRVPGQTQKPKDVLPTQQPITDEVAPRPPARWKVILKRVGIAVLLLIALVMAYLFLLLGEPSNEVSDTPNLQEEVIRVPMAAVEAKGDADMNTVAATFGQPVLVLYGDPAALQKITLSDTAFQGGYARRATLTYAFDDGQLLMVESIRPTAAAALLQGNGYTLNLNSIYSMAGMEAVRMENGNTVCVLGKTDVAVYAILFPASHEADVSALVKQAALWQP